MSGKVKLNQEVMERMGFHFESEGDNKAIEPQWYEEEEDKPKIRSSSDLLREIFLGFDPDLNPDR